MKLSIIGKNLVNFLIATSLIFVCISSFYNSLENDFTFDDSLALVNNGDVKSDIGSFQLWQNDLWGKDIRAHDSHKSYRPFLIKTFQIINRSFSGEPLSFRRFSIMFHMFATLLVYGLSRKITRNEHIGFCAALFFAAHPIHVEAVASIVNMAEAIHTIFVILAYYLFIQSVESRGRSLWRLLLSTVVWLQFVVVAILFKETGLIACALIFAKSVMEIVLFTVGRLRLSTPPNVSVRSVLLYSYWNGMALFVCYLYFSFRALLINADRNELLSSVSHFVYRLLINPSLLSGGGSGSYLGSSQLIRKAENPFAFLHGQEKVLSMLVSCL
jgi:hypothetical protein